jgi:hypothetical protein
VTVQRWIELRGISTLAITVAPDETAQANPPRALHPVGYPPGHSLGTADAALQKRILLDALELVRDQTTPGVIVSRSYDG